ncbi:MAG: ATP-dependent RecD-like DNA helicase [Lachnospiraceae bacterium]|nr:ATP-dependent RecD-like DNA helicase [Lachnospiraceae bacterium]
MEQITGYIDHIIYENNENGYKVLLLVDPDGQELVCVGTIPGVDNGMSLRLEGEFVEHPTYGRQLKVIKFEEVIPDDTAGIERYLSSGAIKGIGESLAKRIVAKFGTDTFRIMEKEPERLAEVKGISLRIAGEIGSQVYEKRELRQAFIFLQKYGISNNLAVKIFERYRDSLYGVMMENPYRIAEDISGVGFKTADEIASRMGINVDSEYRIGSGTLYALQCAGADGNVYLPLEELLDKASEILSVEKEHIYPIVENLAVDKKIIVRQGKVYLPSFYHSELSCAVMLKELNVSMDEREFEREKKRINEVIKKVLRENGLQPDDLQMDALYKCVKNGVTIISGGPGTGKTTTINTLIRYFDEEGMDIMLAAPTGRAAKRMQEATGYEARTIHRLLEVNGGMLLDERSPRFERNSENPLETDVVIIDEMSMIDIHLFKALLSAISVGTRLVMVGDVDQLPSVGPGQVLKDLIDSGAFSTVILKRIFRQDGESDIVVNAHKINEGKQIALDNKSKDFFFLERNDSRVIYKHMVQLITEKLPGYVDATPFDIQVLTPMKKGNLGVETLNGILQQYLNPNDGTKAEYEYKDRIFRTGDKVMQVKNDYQLEWQVLSRYNIPVDSGKGVFNGDTGVIKSIDNAGRILTVEFDEKRQVDYDFSSLDELELAYAVTVHKSQGSEYPAVIFPILQGPRMLLNRNLFYTAVTRAKKCVTILGDPQTVRLMIENENTNDRYTSLKDRIKEVMGTVDQT